MKVINYHPLFIFNFGFRGHSLVCDDCLCVCDNCVALSKNKFVDTFDRVYKRVKKNNEVY